MDLQSLTNAPTSAFGPAELAAAKSARMRDNMFDDLAKMASRSQIDRAIQSACHALEIGVLNETDFRAVTSALTCMRNVLQGRQTVMQRAPELAGKWREEGLSRFKPHIRKTMPSDKKAEYIKRRRGLAASYFMPDDLKVEFTIGQLAALAIVTQEVRKFGKCSLCIEKIAGLAGVCHATVRRALARAAEIGLLAITYRKRRGETNLSNIVTLISLAWLQWVERRKKGLGLADLVKRISAKATSYFSDGSGTKCNPTPDTRNIKGNRPMADCSLFLRLDAGSVEIPIFGNT